MITVRDLEWAAGFLEGEGSFSALRKGRIGVAACQVNKQPIDRLMSLFGGYCVLEYRKKETNGKNIWRWRIGGSKAAGVMMTLFSLLSIVRQEQIKKALAAWMLVEVYVGNRTHCPKGHPYDLENTKLYKRGEYMGRVCLICKHAKNKQYKESESYKQYLAKLKQQRKDKNVRNLKRWRIEEIQVVG